MRPFRLGAAGLLLLLAGQGAEAASNCTSVRDPAGNIRLRCADGATGTLRNDGNGALTGRIGNRTVRVPDANARPAQDSIRNAPRQGSSGRGGVKNNAGTGANCMQGGLRVSDCN